MFASQISRPLIAAFLMTTLTACGGGGGGGDGQSAGANPSSQIISSPSSSQSSVTLQPLTRTNTPFVANNYLELLAFAKDSAAAIVKGEYNTGLADGVYKDTCEGGKGSFEITVAATGNNLQQKYINCELTITENGITEKIVVSGEESIATTRNENTPSIVNILWKNYSIATNNAPAQSLDGSLTYQGLLYFNQNLTYTNITSKIIINSKISVDTQVMNAENIELVYNFPAIFDSYPAAGFGSYISDKGIHVFAGTVISAKGSLGLNDIKSNFSFDATKQRVTFSNSAIAKSYLDITSKGFYIRWDENNNGLADANVFLSEAEYPVLSENLNNSANNIYFTRYPNDYGTPFPPNHINTGQYKSISLSKGASVDINVQEFFTNKSGTLLNYEIDNKSSSADWEQIEAGRFTLRFPNSNGSETFNLKVTALDTYNNRSPEITVTVRMNDNLADTDKDGILDIKDPDIDNDGIANDNDRFPKDPTESTDLDDDGIGDNNDLDRDNDGIANKNDVFPNDTSCHAATSGDEYGCYLSNSRYAFSDENAIAYFIQTISENDKKARLVKFDTITNQFLAPSKILNINGGYVTPRAYDPINKSFLMVRDKKLYLVKLNDLSITSIRDTGEYYIYPYFSENGYFAVKIMDLSNYNYISWIEIFDNHGNLTDANKEESALYPNYYLGVKIQKLESVPFCKFALTIGNTGKLVTHGSQPDPLDICSSVNSTSQNGQYTFLQQPDFVANNVHNLQGDMVLQVNADQMQWLGSALVYITYENDNQRTLVVNDLINNQRHTYKDDNLGDIYVVGEKTLSFQTGQYGIPKKLLVFDKELNIEFDSSAH